MPFNLSLSKGIYFIILATLSFSIMNVMAKHLSEMHAMQIVFLRAFGSSIFIIPWMLYHRVPFLGNNPKLLSLRAIIGCVSLATFFIAIQRIPLGSAISIRYLGPIFGAFFALVFLKEKVKTMQWFYFAIAFAGVLVLKGFDARIDFFSFALVMISAFLVGGVFVLLRYLGDKEHFLTIINYFMSCCVITSLFFVSSFRMPLDGEWYSVIGIGVFGLIGQIFMTKAFQLEETNVLAPFKYLELIFALIIVYFLFGEKYGLYSLLGIGLILFGMIMNVVVKRKPSKI